MYHRVGLGDPAREASLPGRQGRRRPEGQGRQHFPHPERVTSKGEAPPCCPPSKLLLGIRHGRGAVKRVAFQSSGEHPQALGRKEQGPCFHSAIHQLRDQRWVTNRPRLARVCAKTGEVPDKPERAGPARPGERTYHA